MRYDTWKYPDDKEPGQHLSLDYNVIGYDSTAQLH